MNRLGSRGIVRRNRWRYECRCHRLSILNVPTSFQTGFDKINDVSQQPRRVSHASSFKLRVAGSIVWTRKDPTLELISRTKLDCRDSAGKWSASGGEEALAFAMWCVGSPLFSHFNESRAAVEDGVTTCGCVTSHCE